MKKKIIGIAIVTIAAVGTAWNLDVNKDEVTISDLALENVEALAQGEIIVGYPCISTSQICYVISDQFGNDLIYGYRKWN